MATTTEYIQYVCERITSDYAVRYKKMFGDYMVYVNDKPIFLVCDNTVYVKKLPQLSELMSAAEVGVPYDGTKEHYILDIDNGELVESVTGVLEAVTPVPKKRIR